MQLVRTATLPLFCLALGALLGAAIPWSPRADGETRTADGVILLDAQKVAAAFEKGRMLLTTDEYKVMAGHRETGGVPEVHAGDTDVFYILDGEATFVTGGKVVDPRTESAGEVRGTRVDGGEAHRLKKGDVIVIPRGLPHWFQDVPKLVNYFVVKVTAGGGEARAEKKAGK